MAVDTHYFPDRINGWIQEFHISYYSGSWVIKCGLLHKFHIKPSNYHLNSFIWFLIDWTVLSNFQLLYFFISHRQHCVPVSSECSGTQHLLNSSVLPLLWKTHFSPNTRYRGTINRLVLPSQCAGTFNSTFLLQKSLHASSHQLPAFML